MRWDLAISPAGRASVRAGSGRHGLRHLVEPLPEAPAVALEVERLVAALTPDMVARSVRDPCAGSDRTLEVRLDVADLHADVLALDATAHGTDRAVGPLSADPDHTVGELDVGMEEHALRAHHPRDLVEPERAFQEREGGAHVVVWKLGHDRGSARGRAVLPDRRHEPLLSPVERRRVECGVAPQLPRQVHRVHRPVTLFFPLGSSSSRSWARARLSRDRTVPTGSSRASATLWYERSSHAKSRSASRSPSGSASIASATREKRSRASRAVPLVRSAATSADTIRALARRRRASARRCFSSRFEAIPYSQGSALA